MNIKTFADKYLLRSKTDDCGETIIPGSQGQIYFYADTTMGVMFMPAGTKDEPWGKWQPKRWGNFRRSAQALGMAVVKNGDSEGCLEFDPENAEQVSFALKIAGIRPKRQMSPNQRATLARFSFKAPDPAIDGTLVTPDRGTGGERPSGRESTL